MKHATVSRIAILPLLLALLSWLCACAGTGSGGTPSGTGTGTSALWENARYQQDTVLATTEETVTLRVRAEGKSVTLTLDAAAGDLGTLLLGQGLISGTPGPYGLYIDAVNGIPADYNVNRSWWALTVNGAASAVGISGVSVTPGALYELTYTR